MGEEGWETPASTLSPRPGPGFPLRVLLLPAIQPAKEWREAPGRGRSLGRAGT